MQINITWKQALAAIIVAGLFFGAGLVVGGNQETTQAGFTESDLNVLANMGNILLQCQKLICVVDPSTGLLSCDSICNLPRGGA